MKSTVEFGGDLCKERVISIIKSLDLPKKQYIATPNWTENGSITIKERLQSFLCYDYPRVWFKSLDIKKQYEQVYGENINLSTVSTYLARMYRDGILDRRGNRVQREYKFIENGDIENNFVESDFESLSLY